MKAEFPHCDDKVLHAPGECRFCDDFPDLQRERLFQGINFTGHQESGFLPCPAEERRSLDIINAWGGNRPKKKHNQL